eukprot:CAMPEP_0206330248 /NCGR_PEP_ID=MMETSP0106_2-20121207/23623_1 /ASSEMBLY_ACC=CAM_ASM_000206 /TAXON_ID=81532 /ORGANISM="Acanthoeca-like sp., Strain 10tr" /LENGTH=71 /DNA_ID=CAMNT_0053763005 /DNA_START=271 /DNA_END=486 /DNA_ORIENTATION=-
MTPSVSPMIMSPGLTTCPPMVVGFPRAVACRLIAKDGDANREKTGQAASLHCANLHTPPSVTTPTAPRGAR